MKLVDAEIHHAKDDSGEHPTPPRPEHRRVYVSLFLTLGVLAATVVTVYLVVPERNNEILTTVNREHSTTEFDLENPTAKELAAWTTGLFGRSVPWPEHDSLTVIGCRSMRVLRRDAAIVRFDAAGSAVTLLALRARDAPPRKHRRRENGNYSVSWRRGKWTFAAVGPTETHKAWRDLIDAP